MEGRKEEKNPEQSSDDSMRSVKAKMYHAYYSFLSKYQIILGDSPRDVSVTGSLLLAGSEVSKWNLECSQDFLL